MPFDLESLVQALTEGERDLSLAIVDALVGDGTSSLDIVTGGIERAMAALDKKCTAEQFNLLEIMLAGRAVVAVIHRLFPEDADLPAPRAVVVVALDPFYFETLFRAINVDGRLWGALTKTDGDARGGAALSVRQVTGAPIKFAGVSEKLDGLEVFDAERHAGRILGMGDILALVEQVTAGVNIDAAQKLAAKVKSGGGFDLNDFLAQIQQMKQMGGLSSLMDKLPAAMTAKAGQVDMDKAEKDIRRKEGIIHSMTPLERRKPDLIKATRKRRIAQGAGVQVQEVNRLLKEFEQMQDMMKKMKGGGLMKMMKRMGGMKGMGGFPGMR